VGECVVLDAIEQQPLVTVGIPLYNHEAYIRQCVESVLDQTYQNLEVIVIDDGSKDNSFQVLEALAKERSDPRLKISSRPNKGMCNTLNEIVEKSQGEYFSATASDDFWELNKIAEQVAFLEKFSDYGLVHSNAKKIDSEGEYLKLIDYSGKVNSGYVFEAIVLGHGGINTPSNLFRMSVFDEVGCYDAQFSFEDTDFWLRLSKHFKVGYIKGSHAYYRWHGKNFSLNKAKGMRYFEEMENIYKKNIESKYLLKKGLHRQYLKATRKSLLSFEFVTAIMYLKKLFANRFLY